PHLRTALASPSRTWVEGVAFAPDGKTLAAAIGEEVRLIDIATGGERGILRDNLSRVSLRRVCYSPDGRWLAAGDWNTAELLWDLAGGRWWGKLAEYSGGGLSSWALNLGNASAAFSPDGKLIAVAVRAGHVESPGEVQIVEVLSRKERLRLQGHGREIW